MCLWLDRPGFGQLQLQTLWTNIWTMDNHLQWKHAHHYIQVRWYRDTDWIPGSLDCHNWTSNISHYIIHWLWRLYLPVSLCWQIIWYLHKYWWRPTMVSPLSTTRSDWPGDPYHYCEVLLFWYRLIMSQYASDVNRCIQSTRQLL